jgi:hypothetical protein
MLRSGLRLSVLVAVFPLLGCQLIGASITSPSDWVSGTGTSISGSFRGLGVSSGSDDKGSGSENTAYRRDVRAFAAQFSQAGGSSDEFLRGIAKVAEGHGVSHWEARPDTMKAIGAGLRDAGVSRAELDALYTRSGDADPQVLALVLEGYAAAR